MVYYLYTDKNGAPIKFAAVVTGIRGRWYLIRVGRYDVHSKEVSTFESVVAESSLQPRTFPVVTKTNCSSGPDPGCYTTLRAIAPVFLIIATGYLLFRTKVVDETVWSAVEHICFYLLFPFLIIRTLSRANLGSVPIVDFMIVLVVAILGMAAILILIQAFVWKRYPQSGPSFSSVFQGATRFHGFVAIAVIGPLYGDDGVTLAALALAIMVPLLNVISVIVLSVYGRSDSKPEVSRCCRKLRPTR